MAPVSSEITSGSAADSVKKARNPSQERRVDVADVARDRVVDGVDQPVGQPQRVALRQALPRAEFVVDGLAADARGAWRRPTA